MACAVQACAGSASLSPGLVVLSLGTVADSVPLCWCSAVPLSCGAILLASAIIGGHNCWVWSGPVRLLQVLPGAL